MGCDLEVEIAPSEEYGTYRVNVDSPAGATSGELRLDVDGLLGRRREVAASVLASAVKTRAGLPIQERPVREVGQALFEGLFAERVYGRYTASLQEASRRGEPLRVVLRLRAPELGGLPWETLFDPEAREYLCHREPVIRYVEAPRAANPLRVEPPLRILGLIAAPRDLPRLDVAEEQRRLDDALAELPRGSVEVHWAPDGTWPTLQYLLLEGPWHVVHFVGHGGMNDTGDSGVLALEEEHTKRATHVSASRFARLLHVGRPEPRLVVLNACQSGEGAADDLLSSTAAALVHSGISAAVAMQFAVTDPAALAFARGFYQAIAQARPVDEAVRLGRIAIDGTGEHTLEWVTPVVYLRTDDTRLFDVSAPRPEVSRVPAEDVAKDAGLHALYMDARAMLRAGRDDDAVPLLDSVLIQDPTYRDARELRDAAQARLQEPPRPQPAPNGRRHGTGMHNAMLLMRDVIAAAAVAAVAGGFVRAVTQPEGTAGDWERLFALSAARALGWALIVGVVSAVIAWRLQSGEWRGAAARGFVVGGAAGLLGGAVHGVLRYYLDVSTTAEVELGAFPVAPVLGLVVTGAVAGAYIGRHFGATAAGLAGGLAGGLFAGLIAFAWLRPPDDDVLGALTWAIHAVPICAAAVGLAALGHDARLWAPRRA
jgi:hypothetical protein